jgi:YVTN family beta-propeller protein
VAKSCSLPARASWWSTTCLPKQRVLDLGERRLKDLPRPERIYQLVVDGLPSEFAPLRTVDEQELAEAAQQALTRRRYRRRVALALPAAVLVGAATVAAVFLMRDSAAVSVEPNSLAVIDPDSNKIVDSVSVGIRPGAVAVGEGAVWVANTEDETISRINSQTRRVDRTLSLGAYPSDVAVGLGAVWIPHGLVSTVTRLDPKFYGIESIALPRRRGFGDLMCHSGTPEAGVAVGNGRVWVICPDAMLMRIDPNDNRADTLNFAGVGTVAIAFAADRIWTVDRDQNAVFRVSPRSALAEQVTVLSSPLSVAVNEDAAWVANSGAEAVSRIEISEPGTALTSQSVSIGAKPFEVAVGEGAVWTANSEDGTVSRIDPGSGDVVATIEVGNRPVGIAAGEGVAASESRSPVDSSRIPDRI